MRVLFVLCAHGVVSDALLFDHVMVSYYAQDESPVRQRALRLYSASVPYIDVFQYDSKFIIMILTDVWCRAGPWGPRGERGLATTRTT